MSPFLVGLTLGGLTGFALGSVAVRLLRLLALAAVGVAVWLLAEGGLPALDASIATARGWLGPYTATASGAAVGTLLGSVLAGLLPREREDGC